MSSIPHTQYGLHLCERMWTRPYLIGRGMGWSGCGRDIAHVHHNDGLGLKISALCLNWNQFVWWWPSLQKGRPNGMAWTWGVLWDRKTKQWAKPDSHVCDITIHFILCLTRKLCLLIIIYIDTAYCKILNFVCPRFRRLELWNYFGTLDSGVLFAELPVIQYTKNSIAVLRWVNCHITCLVSKTKLIRIITVWHKHKKMINQMHNVTAHQQTMVMSVNNTTV